MHKHNKRNKMRKIFENQGFEAFRKSFRMLFASFSQNWHLLKTML